MTLSIVPRLTKVKVLYTLFKVLFAMLLCLPPVYAGPLDETRYCGPPERLADGTIKRRADVIRAFKRIHPCPATGLSTGPCSGWQVDHVIPLVCWGCDSVANLQWLPVEIKTAPGTLAKDRWEQRVYCQF